MNAIQKSEAIKAGLRKGFQDGNSKMAQRRCYGYVIGPNGQLTVNPNEAAVVRWIFERYLRGDSLGEIVSALETKCILSPTGKSKWNRESISCCPMKNTQAGCCSRKLSAQVDLNSKMMASWIGISTPIPMRPLFLIISYHFLKIQKNVLTVFPFNSPTLYYNLK